MFIQVALPLPLAQHAKEIGDQLAAHQYEPTGVLLGSGMYGTTLLAKKGKKFFAIKVQAPLTREDGMAAENEARIARALGVQHHVAGAVDSWTAASIYYLVMPFVQGSTLADYLDEHGPLLPAQVADLGGQIGEGLCWLHQQGVIHRDLSANNVMVDEYGVAWIIDFNISKDRKGTVEGFANIGTPPYVPPESYRLLLTDELTDQYAWGALLADMACGKGFSVPEAPDRMQGTPVTIRQVNYAIPSDLEAVMLTALSLERSARFTSMQEALTALKRANTKPAHPVVKPLFPLPTIAPQPPAVPPLPPNNKAKRKANQCPHCGHQHQAKVEFCDDCGAQMNPQPVVQGAARAAVPAKAVQVAQPALVVTRFEVSPFSHLMVLLLGGSLRFSGDQLSWPGRFMVRLHYVAILTAGFAAAGIILMLWNGDSGYLRLMFLPWVAMLLWFLARTWGVGVTRRNTMGSGARAGSLLVSEVGFFGGAWLTWYVWLHHPFVGNGNLVILALMCIVDMLFSYYCLELWLN